MTFTLSLAVFCQSVEAGEGGEVELVSDMGLVRQQREAARDRGDRKKVGKGGKGRKGSKAKKLKRKNKKDKKDQKSERRRSRQKAGIQKNKSRQRKHKRKGQKKAQGRRRQPGLKKKKTKSQRARKKTPKGVVGLGRQTSSCNGTSLSTACLPNLISALKFERDKISTFGNQKARADTFKRLIEKKSVKNNAFTNTSAYLLVALGGNTSSLNCSFKVGC